MEPGSPLSPTHSDESKDTERRLTLWQFLGLQFQHERWEERNRFFGEEVVSDRDGSSIQSGGNSSECRDTWEKSIVIIVRTIKLMNT